MGAYLTAPVCEKETHEDANQHLAFAASSMQGWRMSQEDAHNAIINFDDKTSLFAVYDGHGGSEIAVYCSKYLPEFLKTLTSYKEGKLKDALIEGFLKFDSKLLEPDVKKILQKLANEEEDEEEEHEFVGSLNPNEENHHNDELNADETQLLKNEAQIPIEELVKRYQNDESNADETQLLKNEAQIPIEELVKRYQNDENKEEKIPNIEIDDEQQTITLKSGETPPSSSKRVRKPVTDTETSVPIQSTSLLRHLISNNTDELDDDDDDDDEDDESFHESDEETSGDEAEEQDDTPLDANKTAQIQKLMTKSILAILNRRHKKKKEDNDNTNDDDVKENENDQEGEENGEDNDDNDEEEDENDEDEDEDDDDEEEDAGMIDMDNDPGSSSGCTAVVTLLHDRELFVANAGDSRCVVCRNGRAVEMSIDHKPEDPEERQRIEKAGFKVTLDGRVSGGLNLSRAIGDHAYKKKSALLPEEQAITALPDIRTLTLDNQDEFMVLACDGIWNFMSSQDVIDFVRLRLDKKSLSQICEELFMHCLAPNTHGDGTGCDNMTAIIVKFTSNNNSTTTTTNKRSLSSDDIEETLVNKKLKNTINSVD